MQKFTEQNILHSSFVTAGVLGLSKPPLISHLIFPNMPIYIQTCALWYFFAPQVCDAGEVDRQADGDGVWQKF